MSTIYSIYESLYTYLHELKHVIVTQNSGMQHHHEKLGSNVRTDDAIHEPRRYEDNYYSHMRFQGKSKAVS